MTTSIVPQSIDRAIVLGHQCVAAAAELVPLIDLKQNTSPFIALDLYDLIGLPGTDPETSGKIGLFNQARTAVTDAGAVRRAAIVLGRAFNAKAVNHLKTFLGLRWNPRWQSIGFTNGSIALPRDPMPLMLKVRAHFIANPTHEFAPEELTAVKTNSLVLAITAALNAETIAVAARDDARVNRDLSAANLRQRLIGLRAELDQLLADDDYRWRRFGFSRPADRHIPAIVTGLTLRLSGAPGEVIVEWVPALGAENYRVRYQVQGENVPATEVGLIAEPMTIIKNLAPGKTVIVSVTARNEAGETLPVSASIAVT